MRKFPFMKRLAKNSVLVVLAAMFLVSFTGVRLLFHHCLSCDMVDVYLAAYAGDPSEDIHHRHQQTMHPESSGCHGSCCQDASQHGDSCWLNALACETREVFLKNEDDVTSERVVYRVNTPELNLQLTCQPTLREEPEVLAPWKHCDFLQPPPLLTGKVFVIFAHQLKFC